MNFIEKLITGIGNGFKFIGDMIGSLIDFIAIPLGYLFELMTWVNYLMSQLALVVYHFVMIFVALFQFFFAIVTGLLRTISSWVGFTPSTSYNLPEASRLGFETALEQIGGTGLLTVVPLVLIAISWLYFAIKVIGTLGDKGAKK